MELGSVIGNIERPASMTHAIVPEKDRLARGITSGLVRLSVGLEGLSVLRDAFEEGLVLAYSDAREKTPHTITAL